MYYDEFENALWVGGDIRDGFESWKKVLLKYDGEDWTSYGYFNSSVLSIVRYHDKLIVGGFFTEYNETPCAKLAYLEGDEFVQLAGGSDGTIIRLTEFNDKLYVCGTFTFVGDVACNMVAIYDGNSWSSFTWFPEVDNTDQCYDLLYYEGNYWIAGNFGPVVGEDTNATDIFFGSESDWQPAENGILGSISFVTKLTVYNNELIAGGAIYKSAGNAGHSIMKWNNSEMVWEELGGSITGPNFSTSSFSPVDDMEIYNGKLFICGRFDNAGDIYSPFLTVWDGQKYCWPGGNFTGYGGGGEIEFFNDTLYMACRDSVDGQFVNNLAKYVGDFDFEECSTVGSIGLTQRTPEFRLYPNPAENEITIESDSQITTQVSVTVFNSLGKIVLASLWREGASKHTIPVRTLRSGFYVVVIDSLSERQTIKFMKY